MLLHLLLLLLVLLLLQVEGAEGSSHISRGLSLLHKEQRHSKFEMFHHLEPNATTDQVHKSLVAGKGAALPTQLAS